MDMEKVLASAVTEANKSGRIVEVCGSFTVSQHRIVPAKEVL